MLLLPENSGNETIVNRYNIGEAGRVGEQLQNILPPWSSSPNTFQLRRMKRFPFPLTSAAFAAFSNPLAVDRQEPEVLGRCRCGKNIIIML